MSTRVCNVLFSVLTGVVLSVGIMAEPVQAQTETVVRRLGGSTRFSAPVRNVAALRRMAQANRADLLRILNDNGLQNVSEQVVDAMVNGRVTETTIAPGGRLEWMALRRRGRPEVVRNVRWGGAKPFPAYRFSVESGNSTYTFIVPYDCGNLSLENVATKAAPPPPPPPAPAPPPPAPPPAAAKPAPPPPAAAAPPPPPPPPPPPAAPPAPQAAEAEKRISPFVLGAFGKQRRTLEEDGTFGSYCDPLFGAKGGVEFKVAPKFVIAPAVGVAFNLDEGSRTSGFAEVEFNGLVGSGFIGAGVGIWDFNHGDNATGSLLVHGGVPLTKYSSGQSRLLLAVEGRLFFDNLDQVDNNYQAWAGLRYVFR
jgi:hypothetical protein